MGRLHDFISFTYQSIQIHLFTINKTIIAHVNFKNYILGSIKLNLNKIDYFLPLKNGKVQFKILNEVYLRSIVGLQYINNMGRLM